MSFIKTRKKIVSSAIASSLSVIATAAIAQEQVEVLKLLMCMLKQIKQNH